MSARKHNAKFAPLQILHPLHEVIGGIVIVATKRRTGTGIHLATVSTEDAYTDNLLYRHMVSLLADGSFRVRLRRAWRVLLGLKMAPPKEDE